MFLKSLRKIRMKTDSQPRGFTLIELLISMTILSVVIVLIVEAFWLGSRSLERGEKVMVSETRLRTVRNLLAKQLRSTFPLVRQNDKTGADELHFSGDAQSVKFVTTLPFGLQKEGGLFHVRYFLEEDPATRQTRLMVQQRPAYENDARAFEPDQTSILVLPDLEEADWGFSHQDIWQDTWRGNEEDRLPEKVRLRFRYGSEAAEQEQYHEVVAVLAAAMDVKTMARVKKK